MNKLQAHFRKMQQMAMLHLQGGYSSQLPAVQQIIGTATKPESEDYIFASDMHYMLDGPEQRAAEAEQDQYVEDLKTLVRSLMRDLLVVDHIVTLDMGSYKKTIVASKLIGDG